jgi:hypothetical protein
MIEGMDKPKANFGRKVRRFGGPGVHRLNDREAASPPTDAATARRHPLLGALKGLIRVMPGTDLTKPAGQGWGK